MNIKLQKTFSVGGYPLRVDSLPIDEATPDGGYAITYGSSTHYGLTLDDAYFNLITVLNFIRSEENLAAASTLWKERQTFMASPDVLEFTRRVNLRNEFAQGSI